MKSLAKSIKSAIYAYGVVQQNGKDIFAYEIDGSGNYKAYDDANLPSLLSLPYF
jgi:meiotically up-regulated gene 157 (Mug157) protein